MSTRSISDERVDSEVVGVAGVIEGRMSSPSRFSYARTSWWRWIPALALPLAVASCAPHRVASLDQNATGTAGLVVGDDEEVAYVCPMHGDYTSETEGKCPRCGMMLVKATPFDMRDYHL